MFSTPNQGMSLIERMLLENLAINELPSASGIQVGRTDLGCSSNETVPVIEGTFPNCDLVLDGMGPVEAEFRVNPARMIQCMEALIASSGRSKRDWAKDNSTAVLVKVHKPERPISFEYSAPGQTTTALLMPLVKNK